MTERVYIRPLGLLHGQDAAAAIAAGAASPLAGGTSAFSLAEIIRREGPGGKITRRMATWPELPALTRNDNRLEQQLRALQEPRAPIAGLDWSRPVIMGIVNVTPDSFSDGGRFARARQAIEHGRALAAAGADILDIGGESTRPGAQEVPVEEELERVVPVVEALAKEGFRISVDTRKSQVMSEAAKAGAAILNDVSALTFDPAARQTAACAGLPVVLMHAQGLPETMQDNPQYADVTLDVFDALQSLIEAATAAGIDEEQIIADPGIGFGKTCADNLSLMRNLPLFHALGRPLLLGASRKSFIGQVTGVAGAAERLAGSLAAAQAGLAGAAQILRVHDVAQTVQMARMWRAML